MEVCLQESRSAFPLIQVPMNRFSVLQFLEIQVLCKETQIANFT